MKLNNSLAAAANIFCDMLTSFEFVTPEMVTNRLAEAGLNVPEQAVAATMSLITHTTPGIKRGENNTYSLEQPAAALVSSKQYKVTINTGPTQGQIIGDRAFVESFLNREGVNYYYSESKDEIILLSEMNTRHVVNAVCKKYQIDGSDDLINFITDPLVLEFVKRYHGRSNG